MTCDCGRPLYCKGVCRNCYMRAWNAANQEKVREWRSRQVLRQRHGLESRKSGPCEICKRDDRPLVVDHDHSCCPAGRSCEKCRRGWLCGPCNRAIGYFGDDPETVEAAARYLRAHKGVIA